MTRRLYLDDGVGERRGVVTLNGRPERLLIERHNDNPAQQVGAHVVARVGKIDRPLRTAFIDLGAAPDGTLPLTGGGAAVSEGAWIVVETVSPARRNKGAVLRFIEAGDGPTRVLQSAPSLEARLSAFAPSENVIVGAAGREAADVAEEAALTVEHPLPGGGRLFIEPTQALTAIDVDLGAAAGDARRAAMRANLEAIEASARLLRLKGLGGLVAIDLAGKGHDGARLSAAAKTAFAPDGPGASIGPISRFGVLELALPRNVAPIADLLLDAHGRLTAETVAYRLLRAIERAAGPGVLVQASASSEVVALAEDLITYLRERIGARFSISRKLAATTSDFDIITS